MENPPDLASRRPSPPEPGTIGQLLRFLAPGLARRQRVPAWPPDSFALAMAVLLFSGSYVRAVERWPPPASGKKKRRPSDWSSYISSLGQRWRGYAGQPGSTKVPRDIRGWWKTVHGAAAIPLDALHTGKHAPVVWALLQISAAADEACELVGYPRLESGRGKGAKAFKELADDQLFITSGQGRATLCKEVQMPYYQVLPKGHTPQNGLTIRSFSHNLSLCPTREVAASWINILSPYGGGSPSELVAGEEDHSLNLLLVPWPRRVRKSSFAPLHPTQNGLRNMDPGYGFFSYTPRSIARDLPSFRRLLRAAKRERQIDGIIFPELSLDAADLDALYDVVYEEALDTEGGAIPFLIAGVAETTRKSSPRNLAVSLFVFPAGEPGEDYVIAFDQPKNHRWKLDRSQIEQYFLADRLDPERRWWEHMELSQRGLTFIALKSWLTFCTLICEDLARPDPMADSIRAVGPNLVIALLMDGPQLKPRWPARYATVLADDPGCSVLTFTSLGMAELCVPPGKRKSRVVALWQDAASGEGLREIELEEGADGIVLTLSRSFQTEWTADGRKDPDASFIRLSQVSPVRTRGV